MADEDQGVIAAAITFGIGHEVSFNPKHKTEA